MENWSKKLRYLLISVVFFSLINCSGQYTNEEAQPTHIDELKIIPNKIHGFYISQKDGSALTINENTIVRESLVTVELDENKVPYEVDDVIFSTLEEKILAQELQSFQNTKMLTNGVKIKKIKVLDTLFSMSHNRKIKKVKKHYFINQLNDDNLWDIQHFKVDGRELTFSNLNFATDLNQLKEIDAIENVEAKNQNVIAFKFNLTLEQWSKLEEQTYENAELFKKVKGVIWKTKLDKIHDDFYHFMYLYEDFDPIF